MSKFLVPYAGAERVREAPQVRARRQFVPKSPDYIPPEMRRILDAVCVKHEVTLDMLREHGKRDVKTQRARVEFIVRSIDAGFSRAHVGRVLMRDHSTVIHHYKTAKGVERELPPLDPNSPFGGVLAPFEQRAWELVIQGYSHEQIGGILGITGKTSRGYTSSARRKLRMYAAVERDIVEDLLLWAPLVSLSLESHAGNILYRAAEEIKMLRGKHEN